MRRLFLVRHAKAELSVGRDDYARKLTERGRADARRGAKGLTGPHFPPDGLVHFGAARAGAGAEPERHRLAAKYPTGAVAVLDFSIQRWEQVARNSGMLALYLTPAELEADAD